MGREVYFILILVLLETADYVYSDCHMSNDYVSKSKGTLTRNDPIAGLQLQRVNFLKSGDTLTLTCHKTPTDITSYEITCRGSNFDPPEPINCIEETRSYIVRESPEKDNSCPAIMYDIGIIIKGKFLKLYRACYRKEKVQAYFADETIYKKPTGSPGFKRPAFTADNLITGDQEASYKTANIYDAFVETYGEKQVYVKSKTEVFINRGHLSANSDYLFQDQWNSTFKYANIVPQFESVNSGNWKKIEDWVQANVPSDSKWIIRSGAFGVLNLKNTAGILKPAYLYKNSQNPSSIRDSNPVPEWMYKIIRNADNQPLYVFLTYHNVFDPNRPEPHRCCTKIDCPKPSQKFDLRNQKPGYTICCRPDSFIECLKTV